MGTRLELHNELLKFVGSAYFQPASNITMKYPCIVYSKSSKKRSYSNDSLYLGQQEYQLMLIEKTPDSGVAEQIESYFQYCSIQSNYVADTLQHTILNLYY